MKCRKVCIEREKLALFRSDTLSGFLMQNKALLASASNDALQCAKLWRSVEVFAGQRTRGTTAMELGVGLALGLVFGQKCRNDGRRTILRQDALARFGVPDVSVGAKASGNAHHDAHLRLIHVVVAGDWASGSAFLVLFFDHGDGGWTLLRKDALSGLLVSNVAFQAGTSTFAKQNARPKFVHVIGASVWTRSSTGSELLVLKAFVIYECE
jgi:hypothetical protein